MLETRLRVLRSMPAFRDSGVGDRRISKADGSTVIAATMRPDGSVRRERRVKPGFTPPDEVAAYSASSRVAARRGYTPRQQRTGPVGAAAPTQTQVEAQRHAAKTKSQRKNEARKQRRAEERMTRATAAEEGGGVEDKGEEEPQEEPQESAEEKRAKMHDKLQKNVRKLKKKLRQIAELEELPELNEAQQKKIDGKGALLQKLSIAVNSLDEMAGGEVADT